MCLWSLHNNKLQFPCSAPICFATQSNKYHSCKGQHAQDFKTRFCYTKKELVMITACMSPYKVMLLEAHQQFKFPHARRSETQLLKVHNKQFQYMYIQCDPYFYMSISDWQCTLVSRAGPWWAREVLRHNPSLWAVSTRYIQTFSNYCNDRMSFVMTGNHWQSLASSS